MGETRGRVWALERELRLMYSQSAAEEKAGVSSGGGGSDLERKAVTRRIDKDIESQLQVAGDQQDSLAALEKS